MRMQFGRRLLVSVAILAVIAGTLAGVLGSAVHDANAQVQGSVKVILPLVYKDYQPVQPADYLGIWIGGGNDRHAAAAREAGAGYAIVQVRWSQAQPTVDAVPDFTAYDTIIAELRRQGVRPIIQIRDNPSWAVNEAVHGTCGPLLDAAMLAKFSDFLRAAVTHYWQAPYSVNMWEFYNEPDNRHVAQGEIYGGCWGDYPDQYADLLVAAQGVLDDPSFTNYPAASQIIFGGLAYETETTPAGRINMNFLSQVIDALQASYGAEAAKYFDIVNLHYLSDFESSLPPYWGSIGNKVQAIHDILTSKGDTFKSKFVMVSEISWTENPVNEEKQANYVAKVLAEGLASGANPLLWFSLSWDGDAAYGLMSADLRARPAYYAFRTFAREFGSHITAPRLLSESEIGASGVKGYEALFGDELQKRWVLWATGANVDITIPSGVKQAYDKLGAPIPLTGNRSYTLTQGAIYFRY